MMHLLQSDLHELTSKLEPTNYFERLSGSRILITGGCGFLGNYFTQFFAHLNKCGKVKKPIRTVVLDNFISSSTSSMFSDQNVEYKNVDVSHLPNGFYDSLGSFDHVIFAAGIASPQYYMKFPMTTVKIVTHGLHNLVDQCIKHTPDTFTFFSSSEIYGDPDPSQVPIRELYKGSVSCLGDRACYDESKRVGETICKLAYQEYDIPTRIIRPFNVYGPGSMKNDYRVLPNFVSKYLSGRVVNVYGSGEQTRTFCYVTDAMNGFIRVMMDGENGEPYNVGNPFPEISIRDLASLFSRLYGSDFKSENISHPDNYPSDEPQRRCPDIKKVSELGYTPTVSLEDGIKRFTNWAKSTNWGDSHA